MPVETKTDNLGRRGSFERLGECGRCENSSIGSFKTPFGNEELCVSCLETMQAAIKKFGMKGSIWRCGVNLSDEKLLERSFTSS